MSVRPKKHFGQHFLTNQGIVQKIIEEVKKQQLPILEVGPGAGVLTKHLANLPKFKCVEIDTESQEHLLASGIINEKQLIKGDFLNLPLNEVFDGEPFLLLGNFPYNISTQIVFKMLEYRAYIPTMIGMFQKEVADRICSSNGSKQYGILSVLGQSYYQTSLLTHVEPGSFNPPPKVRSSVIVLQKLNDGFENYHQLKSLVKLAFNQRRKTLKNSLKAGVDISPIENSRYLTLRPEQLSVKDFQDLTIVLNAS